VLTRSTQVVPTTYRTCDVSHVVTEKLSDTEIKSQHQSRAAHQRWEEGRGDIAAKGRGHGLVTTFYRKVDGVWKWASIQTKVDFNEHEFERVFVGSAGKFDKDGNIVEVVP
jgi:scytalone dehydratase